MATLRKSEREELLRLRGEHEELLRLREELVSIRQAREHWPLTMEGYAQPTRDQLTGEILRAAWARAQKITPWYQGNVRDLKPQWIKAFFITFAALATMRRSDTVDLRHDKSMLISACADRAREMDFWAWRDVDDLGPFLLAVIASNDIFFMDPKRAPYDLAFALKIGDGDGRRSSGQGWQDLLAGKFIAPIPQPPMPESIRSPSRVRDGVAPGWGNRPPAPGQVPFWER